MVLALNAYVLMGGADFGGGLWDLLATARGAARSAHRRLDRPIWEANHVWLIVVVVVLFTGFQWRSARSQRSCTFRSR
jgi:cytochrome d ubiquinol oxidase subunit II